MSKKVVVIINGSGGVGKDEFIKYCGDVCRTLNIDSVGPSKMAAQILGWDGVTKDERSRRLISGIKKLSIQYNNGPLLYIIDKLRHNMHYDVAFIHVREPEEIIKVRAAVDEMGMRVTTLLLINRNVKRITSNNSDAHVAKFDYDTMIDNNKTLNDLRLEAVDYITKLLYR